MKFNLTEEEKKKLRSKRISIKSLPDRPIGEIAKILGVDTNRVMQMIGDGDSLASLPTGLLSNSSIDAFSKSSNFKWASDFIAQQDKFTSSLNLYKGLGGGIFDSLHAMDKVTQVFKSSEYVKLLNIAEQAMGPIKQTQAMFNQSILLSDKFRKLGIANLVQETHFDKMLKSNNWLTVIEETNKLNLLAQQNVGLFNWESLGSQASLNQRSISTTKKNFLALSKDYASVFRSFDKEPDWLRSSPTLAKLPSVEYYRHTGLLETISVSEEVEAGPDQSDIELQQETQSSIDIYLPQLNGGLLKMWVGAQQALKSDNADRVRHFSTSVRELITQILHTLAPDHDVRAWSTDPTDFQKNSPTRKARIAYICRELTGGSYGKFLNTDIDAMRDLINLFQGGVHSVDWDMNESQVFALKLRIESTLRFLLEVEFQTNRTTR